MAAKEEDISELASAKTWTELVDTLRRRLRDAPTQLKVFNLLSDGKWHCRSCEGASLGLGQYAGGGGIQGLKRGSKNRPGLVIETSANSCDKCGKRSIGDRWTGNTTDSVVAAHIPPALAKRILELYDYTDAIENRRREPQKLVIDHRFPMIRWGGVEPENDPEMDEREIRRKFQLLTEITREVVRAIECSCHGYTQARTNSRNRSLSDCFDLSQHAHQLSVSRSRMRPYLA